MQKGKQVKKESSIKVEVTLDSPLLEKFRIITSWEANKNKTDEQVIKEIIKEYARVYILPDSHLGYYAQIPDDE